MPQQEKQPSTLTDMRGSFNLAYHLASIHFACFQPFLRCGQGVRLPGFYGFFAWVLIWVYGGFARCDEMIVYFWFWLAAVIYRRVTADPAQCSCYPGWPLLTGWMFRDELHARWAEAACMWVIGGLLSCWSEKLGAFVTFGTVSMGWKCWADSLAIRNLEIARRDAEILARMHQQRFRDGGW